MILIIFYLPTDILRYAFLLSCVSPTLLLLVMLRVSQNCWDCLVRLRFFHFPFQKCWPRRDTCQRQQANQRTQNFDGITRLNFVTPSQKNKTVFFAIYTCMRFNSKNFTVYLRKAKLSGSTWLSLHGLFCTLLYYYSIFLRTSSTSSCSSLLLALLLVLLLILLLAFIHTQRMGNGIHVGDRDLVKTKNVQVICEINYTQGRDSKQ